MTKPRERKADTLNNYHEQQLIWIDNQLNNEKNVFVNPDKGLANWKEFNNTPKLAGRERELIPFHQQLPPDVVRFVASNMTDQAIDNMVRNIRIWRSRVGGGIKNDNYKLQVNLTAQTRENLKRVCDHHGLLMGDMITKMINTEAKKKKYLTQND